MYNSETITFKVEDSALSIHVGLLKESSPTLERMTKSLMGEAKQGFTSKDNIDKKTFARFVQRAYECYYHPREIVSFAADDDALTILSDWPITPERRTRDWSSSGYM